MKQGTWKKLGVEVFSIVFAVLLALVLNHWREDVLDRKSSNHALQNVLIEIATNRQDLVQEVENLDTLIHQLKGRLGQLKEGQESDAGLGISFTLLSHSAWEMAQVTGAVKNFDLDFLMNVSELYEFQEICHDNGLSIIDRINTMSYSKEIDQEVMITSMIRQLQVQKRWVEDLANAYKKLLQEHPGLVESHLPDSLQLI
ncbi:hypothetical protein [Reichenbachiella ulvae]|uniref:Uncharacterized protein n=1 Tax=Reichenbachiella ulvae TaxID=2980104 RepID=A0ABT3CP23_9BACT|nr:hypothetical protein [Reichenbachiella ulvae]MCV9385488.1 hypothetical protein [Reichenbachiella ulvae]